jgi:hypothetical protein
MRLLSTTKPLRLALLPIVVCASVLASASAFAAGKAGGASSAPASSPSGSSASEHSDPLDVALEGEDTATAKSWEVGGVVETHRLFIQNDLEGYANNKVVNYLHLFARWDITKQDAVELRGYLFERVLVDPGETGFRLDDTVLHYSHKFNGLPDDWGIRVYANVTAPTSFYSQLMSLYTAPRVGIEGSYHHGPFTAALLFYGETYITKYRQMQGGNPNPWLHGAFYLDASYRLPLLGWLGEPLSVGAMFTAHRTWLRDAGGGGAQPDALGVVADAQYDGQPVQGSYGGEVYLRYQLPRMNGLRSDVTIAAAQGDPTLGYTSSLHDGIAHTYLFWRQSAQVFLALSARY